MLFQHPDVAGEMASGGIGVHRSRHVDMELLENGPDQVSNFLVVSGFDRPECYNGH